MRYDKPDDYKPLHERLDVKVTTDTDENGAMLLTFIHYPLHDKDNSESVQEYVTYEVQRVLGHRRDANTEIGVAGTVYDVLIKVSESKTQQTRIWHENPLWCVAKKMRK